MQIVQTGQKGLILTGLMLLILPLSWYCGKTESEPEARRAASPTTGATYKALRTVDVTVRGAGDLEIDGVATRLEDLREALETSAGAKKEDVVIVIRCKPDLSMNQMKAVHTAMMAADLRKVIYRDDAGNELPLILPSQDMQVRLPHLPAEDVVILVVAASGDMVHDGRHVGTAEVTESIRQSISENPNTVVSIKTDGSSHYSDFVKALASAKAAGAARISVE